MLHRGGLCSLAPSRSYPTISSSPTVSPTFSILVKLGCCRRPVISIRQLHLCNLDVVLGSLRGMCPDQQSLHILVCIWKPLTSQGGPFEGVRDDETGSDRTTYSYRNGEFFFQILYSSLMSFSSWIIVSWTGVVVIVLEQAVFSRLEDLEYWLGESFDLVFAMVHVSLLGFVRVGRMPSEFG